MIFQKFLNYSIDYWGKALLCSPSWLELKILLTWTPRCWDWQVCTSTPKAIKVLPKVTETFLSSLSTIRKLLSQRNVLWWKIFTVEKIKINFWCHNPWSNCSLRYFMYVTDPKKDGSSSCGRTRQKSQDQTLQNKEHKLETAWGGAGVSRTSLGISFAALQPLLKQTPSIHLLTAKRIYLV